MRRHLLALNLEGDQRHTRRIDENGRAYVRDAGGDGNRLDGCADRMRRDRVRSAGPAGADVPDDGGREGRAVRNRIGDGPDLDALR